LHQSGDGFAQNGAFGFTQNRQCTRLAPIRTEMSECCIWSAPRRNGFVHVGFSEPIRQEFSTDGDSPTARDSGLDILGGSILSGSPGCGVHFFALASNLAKSIGCLPSGSEFGQSSKQPIHGRRRILQKCTLQC